jgi:hypothetical protein
MTAIADGSDVTADEWRAALHLVAHLEEAVDRRDVRAFVQLFTPDGRMTGEMAADHDRLAGVATGHDAEGPALMHLTANHVVERAEDEGLRVRYLLVVLALGTVPAVLRVNRITDHLRPGPAGWRIEEHHVGPGDIVAARRPPGPHPATDRPVRSDRT